MWFCWVHRAMTSACTFMTCSHELKGRHHRWKQQEVELPFLHSERRQLRWFGDLTDMCPG